MFEETKNLHPDIRHHAKRLHNGLQYQYALIQYAYKEFHEKW